MAKVLQLYDGTTTVNLLSGTLKLTDDGFAFRTGRGKVWQTLDLVGDAADATIRTVQAQVDALLEKARDYAADPLNSDPVWFYWQSDGESAKRHLVYDGDTDLLADGNMLAGPTLGNSFAKLRLAIQIDGEAETSAATTVTTANVSADAGSWLIGNAVGTANQRISKLEVSANSGVGQLSKVWCGIRPLYKGTAGFIGNWDCELGSMGTDTTVTDGAAVCDFGTDETLVNRLGLAWFQVGNYSANSEHLIGEYLVLLACSVNNADTEVNIELRHGWVGFAGKESIIGSAYIDGTQTSVKLVEMGVAQIPPTGNRDNVASDSDRVMDYAFAIYAERIAGTGSLYMDRIFLIPSKHLAVADGAAVTDGPLEFHTAPNWEQYAIARAAARWGNVESTFDNWEYPVGGGLLVIAAQQANSIAYGRELDLSITLVPRWATYRTA